MKWSLPWSAVDQSGEIAELRAEIERLRKSRHEARHERDQLRKEAEEARSDLEIAEAQRGSQRESAEFWMQEAERLRSVLTGIGDQARRSVCAPGGPDPKEPVHSGQFVAHSGSFGWIPVDERMPDEEFDEVDVLVVAETANDRWTDRAWLANEDRSWRWSADDSRLVDGIRITHWMPIPEPPGCEGAPPVLSAQRGPWVAVGDERPDDPDQEVVVLAGGYPVPGHYHRDVGWTNSHGTGVSGVTHWARMPGREVSGVSGGPVGGSGLVHRGGDGGDVDPESLGDGGVSVDSGLLRPPHPVVGSDAGHADSSGEVFHGLAGGREEEAHGGHGRDCAPGSGDSQLSDSSVLT